MCGEVGGRRGAVVAMRMCVVMHCAMAFWWGSSLGALLLRFVCDVPLVLLRDCFCVAVLLTYCCAIITGDDTLSPHGYVGFTPSVLGV